MQIPLNTGACINIASTVLLSFIVIDVGLVEPDKSPLHPVKVYPVAGVAVSWMVEP